MVRDGNAKRHRSNGNGNPAQCNRSWLVVPDLAQRGKNDHQRENGNPQRLHGVDGVLYPATLSMLEADPVHGRPSQEKRERQQPDRIERTQLLAEPPGIHGEHGGNADEKATGHTPEGVIQMICPPSP